MSDYGKISSSMKSNADDAGQSLSSVKKISFDGVWSGSAYDSLTTALNNTVKKADKEMANYESFTQAMEQLDSYKAKKERIDELSSLISKVSIPDQEKDPSGYASAISTINGYKSEQTELEEEKKDLRKSIEGTLSGITANTADLNLVKFSFNDTNFDLEFDVVSLYNTYNNGSLKMMSASDSLYKHYDLYDDAGNLVRSGKDYVEGIIVDIQKKYSGREAAVNAGLAILKLASDAGIKLNYEHAGTAGTYPYVRTSSVATGVDCNPYVSWCLDKGVEGGFQWRPVGNFTSIGNTIEYNNWSSAKPGDVMANGGHVTMVVHNDPETGIITYMHASGQVNGITITRSKYSTLRNNGYTIRDMTNVYDGTENTDRWDAFANYVDPNTYQRTYV